MRGIELDAVLRRHPATRRQFRGVYALDQLPRRLLLPAALVVNTDIGRNPGEHWIAIYIDAWGVGTFFDSFGLPPLHPHLTLFLKRNAVKWYHSAFHVQSVISIQCGKFAAYFLYCKCRGRTLPRLLRPFKPLQQELNDRVINSWWRRWHLL